MKAKLTCFILLICSLFACGPEKTIDNRRASSDSMQVDFSDANSLEQFQKKFQIHVEWDTPPKAGTKHENRFKVYFTDLNNELVKASFLDFSLYMKMHGHGGLDKDRIVELVDDEYFICSNFYFTMSDAWELQFRFVIGNEKYAFDHPVYVED
ncbi:MAG: hypothetical protein HRU09_05965 [Oligoflexales bacterium]|nr:hypothetical protein [Oligoflexales bacterium]